MHTYVLGLHEVDRSHLGLVGGKGANLGELARLDGVRVPAGFCVSTQAFQRALASAAAIGGLLERLAGLRADDREAIRELAAAIRGGVEGLAVPADVHDAIAGHLATLGEQAAYAVRSSATAEDLPDASFAGQHDSYLNVMGKAAILQHVRRCWASLFTERAIAYRLHHGFDHRKVHMAVVVQKMLRPQAAGVLFTADPVTGNRKVASIEAAFGLGEALVAGLVQPDGYKVRDGQVVEKTVAPKDRDRQVLTDAQIVRLAQLGRRIEGHFGQPQDLEWCLVGDEFHLVQSRPITSLYPTPEAAEPGSRVYVSVGHQQMMTDALRPLGLSLFQATAARPMYAAGGRLFVDITRELSSPVGRAAILDGLGRSDPLIQDALTTLLQRGDFLPPLPTDPPALGQPGGPHAQPPIEADPALVTDLIARSQASIQALAQEIRGKTGTELLEFLVADVQLLKQSVTEPKNVAAIMAGLGAATWLNQHLLDWLGEKNAADVLSQSVANNVTSEMGLALLDVADVIRPYPQVVAYLRQVTDDEGLLAGLLPLDGGPQAHAALRAYLDKYGMRCPGEIDVTRPRWSEQPTALVPLLLSNVQNFQPGAARRKFEQGRQQALDKEREVLERLAQLPDGEQKAAQTEQMIRRLRTFIAYREYPKYAIVSRYFHYRQALWQEAQRLVRAGVLAEPDDLAYLTLQEVREVVRTQSLDGQRVAQRKAEHERHRKLTPPRVLTSDGEVVAGAYQRTGLPSGALVGLPVSAGVVEGRARVLRDMAQARLEVGDILVTTFTDPSWTPLFVAIKGLVTEVGGLMTHGSVIAREYGLPAVVGVQDATRRIADGQRIRLHGTDGYVQILD